MERKYLGLALILLFFTTIPIFADVVPLDLLVQKTATTLQWDSYRESGLLWKGINVLAVSLDSDFAVYNYKERVDIDTIVQDDHGRILLSKAAADLIQKLFTVENSNRTQEISTIFIDPGHGGKDPGAIGEYIADNGERKSIYEKDIVLRVGQYLQHSLIKQYPNKQIILSRMRDAFVSLDQRTQLANSITVKQNQSILFISLHVNASLNKEAHGFEVWYLPPDYRRSNLVDAKTVGVSDNDVLSILNTIKEEEFTIESVLLAKDIINGLQGSIGNISKNRGIKQESWYVVRQAKMPSILIELGFISNSAEGKLLNDTQYLRKVTQGIYNGIVTFIDEFE